MTKQTQPKIAAVVLAAGGSRRMGQTKQLLSIEGQPMVRRVTETVCAVGLDQIVVVVGADAQAVEKALSGLPVDVVLNADWPEGMSTSVRTGIQALRPDIEAALLVLADQPGLTAALLRVLVGCYITTGGPIVLPVHGGQRGNPVLFDRSLFSELMAVGGDRGGRVLIQRHGERVQYVPVDDPAVILDVDTREDYEQVSDWGEASGLK